MRLPARLRASRAARARRAPAGGPSRSNGACLRPCKWHSHRFLASAAAPGARARQRACCRPRCWRGADIARRGGPPCPSMPSAAGCTGRRRIAAASSMCRTRRSATPSTMRRPCSGARSTRCGWGPAPARIASSAPPSPSERSRRRPTCCRPGAPRARLPASIAARQHRPGLPGCGVRARARRPSHARRVSAPILAATSRARLDRAAGARLHY